MKFFSSILLAGQVMHLLSSGPGWHVRQDGVSHLMHFLELSA